jgi:hypothetical protein
MEKHRNLSDNVRGCGSYVHFPAGSSDFAGVHVALAAGMAVAGVALVVGVALARVMLTVGLVLAVVVLVVGVVLVCRRSGRRTR